MFGDERIDHAREPRRDRLVLFGGSRRHEELPVDQLVLVAVLGQAMELGERPRSRGVGHRHDEPFLGQWIARRMPEDRMAATRPRHRIGSGGVDLLPRRATAERKLGVGAESSGLRGPVASLASLGMTS